MPSFSFFLFFIQDITGHRGPFFFLEILMRYSEEDIFQVPHGQVHTICLTKTQMTSINKINMTR